LGVRVGVRVGPVTPGPAEKPRLRASSGSETGPADAGRASRDGTRVGPGRRSDAVRTTRPAHRTAATGALQQTCAAPEETARQGRGTGARRRSDGLSGEPARRLRRAGGTQKRRKVQLRVRRDGKHRLLARGAARASRRGAAVANVEDPAGPADERRAQRRPDPFRTRTTHGGAAFQQGPESRVRPGRRPGRPSAALPLLLDPLILATPRL
jgi:hypothetical protein